MSDRDADLDMRVWWLELTADDDFKLSHEVFCVAADSRESGAVVRFFTTGGFNVSDYRDPWPFFKRRGTDGPAD